MKHRIGDKDVRPDPDEAFNWLQGWYMAHCDGEWEHSYGVTIETLDNPGWIVRIALQETELATRPFKPLERDWSVADWYDIRVTGEGVFIATCSPLNLSWCLTEFRLWAQKKGP
jgi:hypothetical protein